MTDEHDRLMRVATRIAGSEDPRNAILALARLETQHRARRQQAWFAGAAAALVLLAIAVAMAGGAETPPTPEDRFATEAAWALQLIQRDGKNSLSEQDHARLVANLDSDSSRVRRASLLALSHFGRDIPVLQLERVASGLAETIDLPVRVASEGDAGVRNALLANRATTMRVVSQAIWFHAARHKSYPVVGTIERFTLSSDEVVREHAVRALGEIPGYRASKELRLRIERDTERVRRGSKRLLRRE